MDLSGMDLSGHLPQFRVQGVMLPDADTEAGSAVVATAGGCTVPAYSSTVLMGKLRLVETCVAVRPWPRSSSTPNKTDTAEAELALAVVLGGGAALLVLAGAGRACDDMVTVSCGMAVAGAVCDVAVVLGGGAALLVLAGVG